MPASSLAPRKSRGGGRWDKDRGGGVESGRTLLLLLLPPITTGTSSKDRRSEPWPSAEVEGGGGGVGVGEEGLLGGFLAPPKLKLTMMMAGLVL